MSKSKQSTSHKWTVVGVIGGIAIAVLIASWFAYPKAVGRIVLKGDVYQDSDPAKALVYYQAADYVSGASSGLVIKQVETLNALGQFKAAEKQINRLQHITPQIRQIQARIALEEGRDVERNLDIVLTAPDGATPLMAINSNQTALAAELLARGLVRSSQRVIIAIPQANRSAQDNLILAKSLIKQGDTQGARLALEASLKLDATNLEVYKLYKTTLQQLGENADQVQQKIEQLESGKI
jgi:Flp pilus assembly protein TadD